MQSAIYQLSLVIGLGTLAVLLIRGYSLMTALSRSGLVLVTVLILLVLAGNVIRWSIHPGQNLNEPSRGDSGSDSPEQIPGGDLDDERSNA